MGALGNGRRGGRTPSLLFAALIACVLLLGFNYWVSNSRNVELQAKLLELEERVRQVSAEREREQLSRSDAEEQVHRQTEQLALQEDRNQKQQQSAQNTWKLEKGKLLLNISSSAKTVQEMKNQMKTLLEDLSKVQKELQSCQSNMNTLNKKLTYDMTQCNTQILAMKEECNEKVVKQGVQKKNLSPGGEKQSSAAAGDAAVSAPKDTTPKLSSEGLKRNDTAKSVGELQHAQAPNKDRLKASEILQENDDTAVKDSDRSELPATSKPSNQNRTLNDVANEEDIEEVMDIKGEDLKPAGALLDAAVNGEGKEDEAIEYDNEGEIEKRLSKLKDEKAAQEFEEELADYNGDDDNEPEFEADKQVELAEM
ncbi:Golgi membrane protein 1 isoform X1 [Electrophorus electricus]|uniref:Golgi membrane protein 1 isoform X1 n=1 Tax=Electrophorus electricus TaxID=8005 RepID=UPI0015D05EE8|nr:Golgi membrane protein 1 isoform X1 [Electrophorus electricus]